MHWLIFMIGCVVLWGWWAGVSFSYCCLIKRCHYSIDLIISPGTHSEQKKKVSFMAHNSIYINQTMCCLFGCRTFHLAYWPQGQKPHIVDARILLLCVHSEMTTGCSLSVFRSASFGNLLSSNNNVLRKLSGTLNYSLIPKFKLCKAKEAENQCTFKVIRDHKWNKSELL